MEHIKQTIKDVLEQFIPEFTPKELEAMLLKHPDINAVSMLTGDDEAHMIRKTTFNSHDVDEFLEKERK